MNPIALLQNFFERRFAARAQGIRDFLSRSAPDGFHALIEEHIKKSQTHRHNASRYLLDFSAARNSGRRMPHPEIYWETSFGFVLCAREGSAVIPIAAIGFEIRSNRLVVRQVQGVRGRKEHLRPLHWERLLYRVAISFGRILGIETVHVLPARQSDYYPLGNPEVGCALSRKESIARAQRMHIVYDKESVRCGFKWCEGTQTFMFALLS